MVIIVCLVTALCYNIEYSVIHSVNYLKHFKELIQGWEYENYSVLMVVNVDNCEMPITYCYSYLIN